MSFDWIDLDGRPQVLISSAPIIDAANIVANEIDRLIPDIEDDDIHVRDAARRVLAPLQAKLERLQADLERWDAHADLLTQTAAAELIERLDALPGVIAAVTLVVALHDEHDEMLAMTAGASEARASMLAGYMTVLQRRAFIAIDLRSMPPESMPRGEGKALLDMDPRFARRRADTGGWFAWTDRDDHAHRLVDPLPIEREMVAVVGELNALRPALESEHLPDALFSLVERGVALWQRIQILERDLERFGQADEARDLDECKRYAADWRSKRTRA